MSDRCHLRQRPFLACFTYTMCQRVSVNLYTRKVSGILHLINITYYYLVFENEVDYQLTVDNQI